MGENYIIHHTHLSGTQTQKMYVFAVEKKTLRVWGVLKEIIDMYILTPYCRSLG